jgi:lipopolysaccharide export system protein LptA
MINIVLIMLATLVSAVPDTSQPYMVSANSMKVQMVGQDKVTWLRGEVEIIHGPTIIRGDSARVSTVLEQALIWGHVRITDQTARLSGQSAVYHKKFGRSVLHGRPDLKDAGWTLTADSLVHLKDLAKSYAYGHVGMEDSSAKNMIEGDYGEYWHEKSYGLLSGNPKYTITNGDRKVSTITADRMEAYQESQTAIATGNVQYSEDSVWASAGRMSYFKNQGRMFLEDQPRVWRIDSDLSGRTIELIFQHDSLKNSVVRDSVVLRQFLSEQGDTDLIRSDSLWMEFSQGKISQARAAGSAWSRYHQFEKGKVTGWNITSGNQMEFYFNQGKIDRINVSSDAKGAYFEKEAE